MRFSKGASWIASTRSYWPRTQSSASSDASERCRDATNRAFRDWSASRPACSSFVIFSSSTQDSFIAVRPISNIAAYFGKTAGSAPCR